MKYILTFLFGAGCGVGGTLLWLRKDIKKRLETTENGSELPFTIGDETAPDNSENATRSENTASQGHSEKRERDRVNYNRIVSAYQSGEKPSAPVPVMPRENGYLSHDGSAEDAEDDEEDADIEDDLVDVHSMDDAPEGYFEIDRETFSRDESNEKNFFVYFRGDQIMSTDNGAIIDAPALLVGTEWENWVGHYAPNTAFVRNPRLVTDYEIHVEDGFYEEEFGPIDPIRED
jgi:hypothetical protein